MAKQIATEIDMLGNAIHNLGAGVAATDAANVGQLPSTAGLLPKDGSTAMTGKLVLPATTAASASLNFPPGTAPTAPVDGDMWGAGSALYYRTATTTRQIVSTSTYSTVTQAEAEAGTATTVRWWTAQRVRQAIVAYASAIIHSHVASEITDFVSAAVAACSGSYVPLVTGALATDLNAGAHKITNLAVGVDAGDAVRMSQLQTYGINDEVTDWVTLSSSVANTTQVLQLQDSASTTLTTQKFVGIWEAEYSFQNVTNVGRIQFAITSDGGSNPFLRILGDPADPNTVQIGIKYVGAGTMSIAFYTDTAVGVGNTTWKIRRLFGLNAGTFVLTGTRITSSLLASGYDTSLPGGGTVVPPTYATSSDLKVKKTDANTVQFSGGTQNPISGSNYPTTMGTIPVGYRPSATRYVMGIFSGMSNSVLQLTISTSGVISKVDGSQFTYSAYLDGVSYSL